MFTSVKIISLNYNCSVFEIGEKLRYRIYPHAIKYALHDACTYTLNDNGHNSKGVFQPSAYANQFDYADRQELDCLLHVFQSK